MDKKKEDEILSLAQDILTRRLATQTDIKIDLHNLMHYSAFYLGALTAARRLECYITHTWRGEERVYLAAELKLILESKRTMQLFLENARIGYRNHERDSNGKLKRCEAYFIDDNN